MYGKQAGGLALFSSVNKMLKVEEAELPVPVSKKRLQLSHTKYVAQYTG